MRVQDLIGMRFGKLKVIERGQNFKNGKASWICQCDCGKVKEKAVTGYDLKSGRVQSCGCKYLESNKGKNKMHGDTGIRLYRIWVGMRNRCYCKSAHSYHNYGARNIKVCDEWQDYENFKSWALSSGYADNLTIDRIDNNGNYSPDNCRWATYKQQERNKRGTIHITLDGETKTLAEWAEITGINRETIAWRIKNGWDSSELLIQPDLNNKNIRRGFYE